MKRTKKGLCRFWNGDREIPEALAANLSAGTVGNGTLSKAIYDRHQRSLCAVLSGIVAICDADILVWNVQLRDRFGGEIAVLRTVKNMVSTQVTAGKTAIVFAHDSQIIDPISKVCGDRVAGDRFPGDEL